MGTGYAMQTGGVTASAEAPRKVVKYQYPSCIACSCMPLWIWCLTVTLLSLLLILIMQQLNFGRVVYDREGVSVYNVNIGNSLDVNSDTKCVQVPSGVHCPSDVERQGVGEWPDKFHIYHDGLGRICAHRVDHQSPWGLDLTLTCEINPTTSGDFARVVIGNTLVEHTSTKCVTAPDGVVCDNSAAQLGRTGEWQDTFDIYHKNGQVCAHRTDRPTSWGLNLVLQCRRGENAKEVSFTDITIGNTLSTNSDTKCVDDPGTVICDNAAEQVGRDGRWKDEFNIYMKDGQICAHRTDSKGAWGLNLVLRCKNKVQNS
eukprot:TRINITY_DN43349_c0_g1_i1.p1 TRINITY_DN43349_c0_g1~~TRINITY_DN43349_c0_g1_i1.p1  ORF type:complete len:356 (+),score=31.31 TRINITY_DN43349_c0_g1_i1:124-1068(+)